jgi:hypothetical protein
MGDPGKSNPNERKKMNNYFMVGLCLAFVPMLLVLCLSQVSMFNKSNAGVFWFGCVASSVCCFTSSFLLFRQKTGWVIGVGLVLVLLNILISFSFGCGAVVSQGQV